jgi:glycosyltransferase involved in cell wall biosynthesis
MQRNRVFLDAKPILKNNLSGIGHVTVQIINALSLRKDLDLYLICPYDKYYYLDQYQFSNVKTKKIYIPDKLFSIIARLKNFIPMDLFFGRGIYIFSDYRNWHLKKSRSITFLHDLIFIIYPKTVNSKNLKYLNDNILKWTKRTDSIIAISNNTKKDIVKYLHVDEGKISVLYPGIDRDNFYRRSKKEIDLVRKKYGISEEYILFVGNIEPRKGIDTLINALNILDFKKTLLIIGSDKWIDDRVYIEHLRKAKFKIVHPDKYVPDDDLPSIYSGAIALINPSIYEGFGITPIEAISCNTPVIVADNSTSREVVGNAGLYFKTGSSQDLARKIKIILDNNLHFSKYADLQANRFDSKNFEKKLYEIINKEISNLDHLEHQ